MPPSLALLIWFIVLVALLSFDPAKDSGVSPALWVPLTWMVIMGSRLPSQWFGLQVGTAAQALEEGNGLDRTVFLVLIVLAIGILPRERRLVGLPVRLLQEVVSGPR